MYGHVAPAATVAALSENDKEIGIVTATGSRLCRCLRCDQWGNYEAPTPEQVTAPNAPLPKDLPRPLRGKALDEKVVVRAIALERGAHVLFFVFVIVLLVVVEWGLPGVQDSARQLLASAQDIVADGRPGNSLLVRGLEEISNLSPGHVGLLIAGLAAYAALEGIEAVFLWRGKRWAEYLTVVATAALLPLALQALAEKVTVLRILGVVVDLAILAYLIWTKRLFGVRGGNTGLEEALHADVDWPTLHLNAPVKPIPLEVEQQKALR